MSDHALIAPSSAAAIVACPARVLMCAGVGSHMDGDTTVREEGTAAHWVAEMWCVHGVMPEAGTLAPNGVRVTEHMRETAQQWRRHTVGSFGTFPQYEQRFDVPQVPRCFGTADASSAVLDAVWVSDLKYGYRPVDVWPNYQLAAYAGGVAAHWGTPLDASTTVHLSVYQPRAYHRAGPLRHATVNGQQIADMLATLADAAYQALSPNPEARPGKHCGTCAGRARCGALRDAAHGLAIPVHGQDPLPPSDAERELQYLQQRADLINDYVSGLALEVENHLRTPGYRGERYELRRSAGRLEWVPELQDEARRVAAALGHNITAPAPLITPTQAAEKLGRDVVSMYARRGNPSVKLAPLTPASELFK
jgi:hypothetical protein